MNSSSTELQPVALLGAEDLARLNGRRDGPAWRQLGGHLALLLAGALLWGGAAGPVARWPGLLLLGWGLAFGFCAMHECGHRTAFRSRALNDAVAWGMGVLSFYNADFYRRYHQWHHRHTHQPGLDPELEESPPTTRWSYLLELSGLPWWTGKLRFHRAGLLGQVAGVPYLPPEAAGPVIRSIRLQGAVYGGFLLVSCALGHPLALFWFWLLPLAVGQPLLRFVLLAEHGGCSTSCDGLHNTRTTRTLAPLRRLMWNMPFHSEHHLYPSIPFHALPGAHALLAPHLGHCAPGYLAVHRTFLANPSVLAL
ncbi:MAG: fatty acid desaturase [Synechococcus sp.]